MTLKRQHGFTLIELLIAITLIAFLSILTTQSINKAVRTKAKLQKSIELNSAVRDALRIMTRDVEMAFHHRDTSVELYNKALDDRKKQQQQQQQQPKGGGQPPPPNQQQQLQQQQQNQANQPQKKQPLPQMTFFIGTDEKMDFTTRTNVRTAMDEKTSDQMKVGYSLKDCKMRSNTKETTKCLWRRSDPYLDDDVTRGGAEVPLLENVDELKLRYLGEANNNDWGSQWKSKDGDAGKADKFPAAVEITLVVLDKTMDKPKKITVQTVALVRFPNNKDKAAEAAEQNSAQQTTTTTGAGAPSGGNQGGQGAGFPPPNQ